MSSLGVAGIGSVSISTYRSQITDALPGGISPETLTAAKTGTEELSALPDAAGASLTTAAQQAFTSGMNIAGLVSAAMAVLAALIAATW